MPLTIPQFVHEDAQQVVAEMKADLEVRLGRVLAPADVEMLLINAFAYRETLIRTNLNDTARQNMVAFSRGNMLDYLGQLVGVSRLPADYARCTIQFQLTAGHGTVTIPQGTRIQSTDGKVSFATIADEIVLNTSNTATVVAICTTSGEAGNGYAIGTISIILDPWAFVSTASNIEETAGGADDESDDELRERIKDAPNRFSVAGPDGAYKFFAKSASSSIVDVAVTSPVPGEVNIFPLLKNGALPNQAILDAVLAICDDEKVRPLTDTVIVLAPTAYSFTIDVELTLVTGAVDTEVQGVINALLNTYKTDRLNKLGLDVIRNQISGLCMIPHKVYNCNVVSPAADIITAKEEFAICTGITLTVIGYHDE